MPVTRIAMKFIAGRPEDRQDLAALNVKRADADFVGAYLQRLARLHPEEAGAVSDAQELLAHGGLVHE